jgi:hypothetical protein
MEIYNKNIMAYRTVAMQRPRNEQLYNIRCKELALETTVVARQWQNSDHVGIQTEANATEERRFLRGPCRDVISRTVEIMS